MSATLADGGRLATGAAGRAKVYMVWSHDTMAGTISLEEFNSDQQRYVQWTPLGARNLAREEVLQQSNTSRQKSAGDRLPTTSLTMREPTILHLL